MPRRDGEVFFFGTAMVNVSWWGRRYAGVGGLIEEDVSERQNGFDD
jgi:hypothetical protein